MAEDASKQLDAQELKQESAPTLNSVHWREGN